MSGRGGGVGADVYKELIVVIVKMIKKSREGGPMRGSELVGGIKVLGSE